MAGREGEAVRHVERALSLMEPGHSLTDEALRTLPLEHPGDRQHFLDGIARATAAAGLTDRGTAIRP